MSDTRIDEKFTRLYDEREWAIADCVRLGEILQGALDDYQRAYNRFDATQKELKNYLDGFGVFVSPPEYFKPSGDAKYGS